MSDDYDEKVEAMFEAEDDEYLEFDRIENKRSRRPDLHAFLVLDELQPGAGRYMVCAAWHDEIALDIDVEAIADKLTPEIVRDLVRCGVRYDDDTLKMFA